MKTFHVETIIQYRLCASYINHDIYIQFSVLPWSQVSTCPLTALPSFWLSEIRQKNKNNYPSMIHLNTSTRSVSLWLTWTLPSLQKLDRAAESGGLCWRLGHRPRYPKRHCLPAHTWQHRQTTHTAPIRVIKINNVEINDRFIDFYSASVTSSLTSELNAENKGAPSHLSATASSLSGLKVPSVSMYMALPSPPPWSMGSCGRSPWLHLSRSTTYL